MAGHHEAGIISSISMRLQAMGCVISGKSQVVASRVSVAKELAAHILNCTGLLE